MEIFENYGEYLQDSGQDGDPWGLSEQEFNDYVDILEKILDNDVSVLQKYCMEMQERLRAM